MTNADLTLIGILVDRSGSMSSCRSDMEGGIASFLGEQQKAPGKAWATLAQFDTVYERVYGITDINETQDYALLPRGGTALLDGIGRFVTEVGAELNEMAPSRRPGKVIIVIVTDGYENSSTEWTRAAVKELIDQQQDGYQWEFVFLGANIDAVAEASTLGIRAGSSLTYDVANTPLAMASVSNYVSMTRSGVAANFTDDDRASAR